MLYLGGVGASVEEGKKQSAKLISCGNALEKFLQMVELQGGDPRSIENTKLLPQAQHTMQVVSSRAGYINSLQCEQIGTASVILGGGRERKEDSVDHAVGIVLKKKVGNFVSAGEPLATIHYNDEARGMRARQLIEASFTVTDAAPPAKQPLIHRIIGDRKSSDSKLRYSGEKN